MSFNHELTQKLIDAGSDWLEEINPSDLTVDDLFEILSDMRRLENTGKKIGGFLKEIISVRCKGMEEYDGRMFHVDFKPGHRIGNIDAEKLLEDMGAAFVEKYRKEGTDFTTIKLKVQDKE